MRLWSDGFGNGERIPERYAAGRLDADGSVGFSDNLSPPLAWAEAPPGTRSFALICHDFDVPGDTADLNKADREIAADLPRVDFFHWLLVDLPPTLAELREGEFSRGFTARGKPGPATHHGARHGVNDYSSWFAGDRELAGDYYSYDGPFPPFNDALVHHYAFTLYALSVDRAPVQGRFDGSELRRAIAPHVLAEATLSGTYTLNPRLR